MASVITLDMDGKSFSVIKCLCRCEQQYDQDGNPASGVTGGKISLLLEGSEEDDFAAWICDPQKQMDGTLTLSVDDASFKTIEFKSGYCVKMHESFHSGDYPVLNRWDRFTQFDDVAENYLYEEIVDYQQQSGTSYLVQCSISAAKVTIDGVEHDNNW